MINKFKIGNMDIRSLRKILLKKRFFNFKETFG